MVAKTSETCINTESFSHASGSVPTPDLTTDGTLIFFHASGSVPTEAEVQIIIRDVYEDFGIEHVQVAFQKVRKSYEMMLEKEKTYAISFER